MPLVRVRLVFLESGVWLQMKDGSGNAASFAREDPRTRLIHRLLDLSDGRSSNGSDLPTRGRAASSREGLGRGVSGQFGAR